MPRLCFTSCLFEFSENVGFRYQAAANCSPEVRHSDRLQTKQNYNSRNYFNPEVLLVFSYSLTKEMETRCLAGPSHIWGILFRKLILKMIEKRYIEMD